MTSKSLIRFLSPREYSRRCLSFTIHLHLESRLRISGTVPLLPISCLCVVKKGKVDIFLKPDFSYFNPLKAELNPICHLLALLGPHPFLHIGRIKVKSVLQNVDVVSKRSKFGPVSVEIDYKISGEYSVIQKDGLSFLRLYFLNYTWYVNNPHNI